MGGRSAMRVAAGSFEGSPAVRRDGASAPGDGSRAAVFGPKLRRPVLRPGLVERPRLIRRLMDAAGRLAVVTAPPGFGKSTLLAQWAAADPRRFAFVSLEASENDPVELWNCVVGSVREM